MVVLQFVVREIQLMHDSQFTVGVEDGIETLVLLKLSRRFSGGIPKKPRIDVFPLLDNRGESRIELSNQLGFEGLERQFAF